MRDDPDELLRFAGYQDALAKVADADEPALVAELLAGPDGAMAEAAVVGHLDQQAATLLETALFPAWALRMSDAVAGHPFPTGRLHEWALWRAILTGEAWEPEALRTASNWMQLKIAKRTTSPEALQVLADTGRTKRVRSAAFATLSAHRR